MGSGPIEPEAGGLIDLAMYNDPVLEPPRIVDEFPPRLNDLWLAALAQPDAAMRREAAVAFGRAGAEGMTLDPAAPPALIERMAQDDDAVVRVAAAEALFQLDHTQAAEAMLQVNVAADDVELIVATDRALAQWGHSPAISTWIRRAAADDLPLAVRRSAVDALGVVAAGAGSEVLSTIAANASQPLSLRLAAGAAVGKLLEAGAATPQSVSGAAAPLVDGRRADRQVAAAMIAVTPDEPTSEAGGPRSALLERLLDSEDPTVIASAAAALASADPARLRDRFDALLNHADASVRLAAVNVNLLMATEEPDVQIDRLVARLDDPSVSVRHTAREQLVSLADQEAYADRVRSAVMRGLSAPGWRGVEQAALLAGTIDHEPAADRLVELLRHDRPEARLAAASALRLIAVPSTLPAMLERARELTTMDSGGDLKTAIDISNETVQLFMAFGQMGYTEAESLLRQYVPKASGYLPLTRAAAIYALGKLHEDDPDPSLTRALAGRLADVNSEEPEVIEVRRFAAVSLGRMKAQRQLSTLQRFLAEENASEDIGGAARWAIVRITGENLPPLTPIVHRRVEWFLAPAK